MRRNTAGTVARSFSASKTPVQDCTNVKYFCYGISDKRQAHDRGRGRHDRLEHGPDGADDAPYAQHLPLRSLCSGARGRGRGALPLCVRRGEHHLDERCQGGALGSGLCRFVGRRGPQGRHDARRPAQGQCRDRRTVRQGHQGLLPRCETRRGGLQPGRHYGAGDAHLCGYPPVAAFDPRGAGLHAPAERTRPTRSATAAPTAATASRWRSSLRRRSLPDAPCRS